jgi:putative ABC transport system permease protein
VIRDLKFAVRMLRRTPAFTATAILTLALGIGANTALFSLVKAVLLNSLPYRQPEQLVALGSGDRTTTAVTNVSYWMVQDWKERSHAFESIALYRGWEAEFAGGGKARILRGMRISYDYLPTLGISPMFGRTFMADDDRPDRWHVLLLSCGFWKEQFGGRADAVGRTIELNGTPYEIIGVLPGSYRSIIPPSLNAPVSYGSAEWEPQVVAPLGYDSTQPSACRSCEHLQSVARLRAGVTDATAQAELAGVSASMAKEFPKDYPPEFQGIVTPLQAHLVGRVRETLLLVLWATGLLLLIACVNLANLLLARGAARRQEMAVRAALGAGRRRLLQQLLVESTLLTLLGGAAGIVLAQWGMAALGAWNPVGIPRLDEVRVDAGVLGFSLAISLLTGIVAGLLPGWTAANADQRDALQEASRGTIGPRRGIARGLLVISEVALAFALTVGTGLLLKSVMRVLGVDPGFEPRNLFTTNWALTGPHYQKDEIIIGFNREALGRIEAIPGVESAAFVSTLPLAGGFDRRGFHIRDRHFASDSEAPIVDSYFVSPEYFRTMRIPLRAGRLFTAADTAVAATAPVAIISETTALQMWPGENPLGKAIQLGGRDEKKPWAAIIGIVGEVRQYGLDSEPTPDAYLLMDESSNDFATIVVRSGLEQGALTRAIEAQIAALDKNVPVYGSMEFEDLIATSTAQRRFVAQLIGAFGGLALLLAATGVYGVMSFQVAQRTREFGIRAALGASPGTILQLVMKRGAGVAGLGLCVGLGISLAMSRMMASQLFDVRGDDPIVIGTAILVVGAALVSANYGPARRASRTDPMVALRYE